MVSEVKSEPDEDFIVRMRGLPWAVTVDEIVKFFEGCEIKGGKDGVHLTMSREGRPSGEAFIELDNTNDLESAMKKDREHIGHRYIEVFKTTRADMDWVLDRSGMNVENIMDECCIRLRGLPFGCTKEDVSNFFSGLAIVSNGITFVTENSGRPTGEAYVQFVNKEMVEDALKKHLERIGHRYIEIFRSSLAEVRALTGPKIRPLMAEVISRPTPYDRADRFGGANRLSGRSGPPPRSGRGYEDDWDVHASFRGGRGFSPIARTRSGPETLYDNGSASGSWKRDPGFMVHMRGLPYRASEQDVANFFRPLVPVDIRMLYERGGLPSGEADVEFSTYEEATQAMLKDKANMKNRYIELFLSSPPPRKRAGRPSSIIDESNIPNPSSEVSTLFSRRGVTGSIVGGPGSNSGFDGYYDTPASVFKGANNPAGNNFRPTPGDYRGAVSDYRPSLDADYRPAGGNASFSR